MKPATDGAEWGGWEPALLLGLVPLAATTLVLLLAAAALPSLLLQPDPQGHPGADGMVADGAVAGEVLAVARTARGGWILNGVPLAAPGLARLLRGRPPGVVAVRFQPSHGLASAQVAASLGWLQSQSAVPVLLDPLSPGP